MRAAETFGQMQPDVAAAPGVDLGLDRGRRRNEHDRNVGAPRAHHRHIAGVIARAVLLLVGRIVLLVDDDEAEIGVRQEQRGARADDDTHLAGRDRAPGACAQPRRKLRVPFRRPHPEPLGEAIEKLRGERDLGHQHQRLFAAADDLADRLEIDRGLARSGNAIEQRHAVSALGDARAQRIGRRPLIARERGRGKVGVGRARHRLRRQHQALQHALVDQPIDDARRNAGAVGDLALAARQPVGEKREHAAARWRHTLRQCPRKPYTNTLARRPEVLPHTKRHPQHHAARTQRVAGYPVHEFAQLRLQRRDIELVRYLLEPVVQAGADLDIVGPDHARGLARPQRHADEVAHLQRQGVGDPVGIGVIERDRNQDINEGCNRMQQR